MIRTKYGYVSGVASDTEGVSIFKGIPIGADTKGANRFAPPKEPEAWEGVLACDSWPDRFLQELTGREPGSFWGQEFYYDDNYDPANSENGLAVNVFMPDGAEKQGGLPVFCYIHGGGFTGGYASEIEFNASRLAAQGVIVVFLQYRLSALGWLATPELSKENGGHSGNWAVLDLIHGLKWIRDNIKEFGGDPAKVTIAGQSAGAFAVTMLLRSPLAKGLFRGAIVQSGFTGFINEAGHESSFTTLAEAETGGAEAIKTVFGANATIADVRAISAEELLTPREDAAPNEFGVKLSRLAEITDVIGRATIDDYVFTKESIDLTRKGALDGINIMIGGTSDEYTSLFGDFIDKMGITKDNVTEKLDGQYGEGCAANYDISADANAQAAFMRAGSDACLQKYIYSCELTKNNKDHRSYVYYFNHVPSGRNSDFRGAYHSSELWFMFDSMREGCAHREWSDADHEVARIMSTYWMNFVKNGDPNGDGLAEWKECRNENNYGFMLFGATGSEMRVSTDYPNRDMFFRKKIFQK